MITTTMTRQAFEAALGDLRGSLRRAPVNAEVVRQKMSWIADYDDEQLRTLLSGLQHGQFDNPVGWLTALEAHYNAGHIHFEAQQNLDEIVAYLRRSGAMDSVLPNSARAIRAWESTNRRGQVIGSLFLITGFILGVLGVSGELQWIVEGAGISAKLLNAGPAALAMTLGFLIVWRYKPHVKVHTVIERRIRDLKSQLPTHSGDRRSPQGAVLETKDEETDELQSGPPPSFLVAAGLLALVAVGWQRYFGGSANERRRFVLGQLHAFRDELRIIAFLQTRGDLDAKYSGNPSGIWSAINMDYMAYLFSPETSGHFHADVLGDDPGLDGWSFPEDFRSDA